MFFINAEQRARYAVAEQAIGSFQDSLRSPVLRQKLSESLGSVAGIGSRLYVPNIKHGVLQPPKRPRQADDIAVIALHPKDRLLVARHFTEQSDRQRVNMGQQLVQAGLPTPEVAATVEEIDSMAPYFHGSNPTQLVSAIKYDDKIMAETWTSGYPLPVDRTIFPGVSQKMLKWSRRGRPMIALHYTSPNVRISPTLLLHETVHVDQLESEPLEPVFDRHDHQSNDTHRLAVELPAYHIGAMRSITLLQEGAKESQLEYIDRLHLSMEGVRRGICSVDDPFDTAGIHTQSLINSFRQLNVT